MKMIASLGIFIVFLGIVAGCGSDDKTNPPTGAGDLRFTCLDTSTSTNTKCSSPAAKPFGVDELLSSVTITTTFVGGDISIAHYDSAIVEGIISNTTGTVVKGFSFVHLHIPGCTDMGYIVQDLNIPNNGTQTVGGGGGMCPNATLGETSLTVTSYDTTGNNAAPTYASMPADILAYAAAHDPAAVGTVTFNIVP